MDTRLEEEQQSLALWAQQCIKEEKLEQLIDPSLRYQISPECLKTFIGVASKCLHKHSSERPTMAAVMVSLESTLFSLGRHKISSTEEDVNVNGDSNSNDILLEGTVASPSTPVQFNDNTQCQKGSKKNFFQKGIAFLARGMDIWSLEVRDVKIQTTATNESIGKGDFLIHTQIGKGDFLIHILCILQTCTEFSSLFPLKWLNFSQKAYKSRDTSDNQHYSFR